MNITEQDYAGLVARSRTGSNNAKQPKRATQTPRNGRKPVGDVLRAVKQGKIPHRRVELDGYVFDSIAEGERYKELRLLEKAGKIQQLVVHPPFKLVVNEQQIANYTADFMYWEATYSVPMWKHVVEDVKSAHTRKNREYRRNLKLMRAIHGVEVRTTIR